MRVEHIGDATLYLGDCRDVLPGLGRLDAVVTDPPFNAGKSFANDSLSGSEWAAFCASLAGAVASVSPENILIEVGKNDREMRAAFDRHFDYKWAIALNYTNAMRNGAVGYSNFGLVLWYGGKCYQRFMDRIDCALHNTIGEFEHPSPKEVYHYLRLVEMFSAPDAHIIDPFLGSGTTGVACAQLGRQFTGIEIHEPYFDIACRRIEEAQRQGDLLRDVLPKPEQKALEL